MTNIVTSVLNRIKEKNIKPRPKWIFIFQNFLLWFLIPIFMVFGALSLSIIMHMFVSNDWDLYGRVSGSFFGFVLKTMPYFWIIILVAFLLFLYIDFKNTKNAYKFSFLKVSLFGFSFVFIIGAVFYFSGIAKYFDSNLLRVETYKTLSCQNAKMWNNPEQGIIAGKFVSIEETGGAFKDSNEKFWNVSFKNKNELEKMNPERDIKLIGQKLGENSFYAESFREMRCGCKMKNCSCGNSERNFLNPRSNGCGMKIPN